MKKRIKKYIDNEEKQDMQIWEEVLDEIEPKIDKKLLKKYEQIFKQAFKKTQRINLRISKKDLLEIKAKALEKGISYQSFITMAIKKALKEN